MVFCNKLYNKQIQNPNIEMTHFYIHTLRLVLLSLLFTVSVFMCATLPFLSYFSGLVSGTFPFRHILCASAAHTSQGRWYARWHWMDFIFNRLLKSVCGKFIRFIKQLNALKYKLYPSLFFVLIVPLARRNSHFPVFIWYNERHKPVERSTNFPTIHQFICQVKWNSFSWNNIIL